MERIILFDGVCNLCNGSVQFIINRDPKGKFKFASLQSEVGKQLLRKYAVREDVNSIVFIEGGKCYIQSEAVLRVAKNLAGAWKLLHIFLLIPRPIRDFFYHLIANNRYRWFGARENCMLPTPGLQERFLNDKKDSPFYE